MQEGVFNPKKFAAELINAIGEQEICSIKKSFSNFTGDQKINLLLEFLDLAGGEKFRIQTAFQRLGDFPQLDEFLTKFNNSCQEFQRLNTFFNEVKEENNENVKQPINLSWKQNSITTNNYPSSQSFMFVHLTSNGTNTNSPTFASSKEPCEILSPKPRRHSSDNE